MGKVKELYRKFGREGQEPVEGLERAIRQLQDEPDAEAAIETILPALQNKVIRVFFSYKKKHENAARRIIKALGDNSNKRLKISSMLDFPHFTGQAWREKIRELIGSAQWFVLLFPDPQDDWEWCLYETGLFEANLTSAHRLICLHHADVTLPGPIEDYYAVAATPKDVAGFLKMVYQDDNPVPGMGPINSKIKQEKIVKIAEEIVDAVPRPAKRPIKFCFGPWIQLKIENAAKCESQADLDNAIVVECKDEAMALFGLYKRPRIWGQVRSKIKEQTKGECRWREQLLDAVKAIIAGELPQPIQAVFKAPCGKMYRPTACAINCLGDTSGPIEYIHVTFNEEIGSLDFSAMPEPLPMLVTVLRFALRFRWEVLEQFGKGSMREDDVERLESTLDRMMADWQYRGVGDQAAIESLFSQREAQRISKMYKGYRAIRNEQGTGELDKAIRDKDVIAIPKILVGFFEQSQEFLEMTAERFAELVSGRVCLIPFTARDSEANSPCMTCGQDETLSPPVLSRGA